MDAQQSVVTGLLREGVTVVFDAETPYADLHARVMHVRPLPEEVDETALLHLRADCDHEMCHLAQSDPKVLDKIERPMLKLVHNAIEDGFVELWGSSMWFGVAENLRRSNALVSADLRERATGARSCTRARAVSALQFLVMGEDTKDVCDRLGDDIRPLIGEIGGLLPELRQVRSSSAGRVVAEKVCDIWRWGNRSEPRNKPLCADEKTRAREDKVAVQLEAMPTLAKARKKVIRTIGAAPGSYRAYTNRDVIETVQVTADHRTGVSEFIRSVRHVVPPLRRRLLMEFRSVGRRYEYDRRSGQLDRSALHRVALGDDRVFRREVPVPVVDADVTLLVDISGSMTLKAPSGGTRIQLAAQAAGATSMVLDLIGVSNECLAFTTRDSFVPPGVRVSFDRGVYQRVRALRHLVVKDVRQSFRQARAAFVSMAEFMGCDENIDGESLLWAARRLLARARPGVVPILIVYSDGEPASSPEEAHVLADHLKRSVERITAAGVVVLMIGIGTDSVRRFCRDSTVIGNISDLTEASYELLRRVLRRSQNLRF